MNRFYEIIAPSLAASVLACLAVVSSARAQAAPLAYVLTPAADQVFLRGKVLTADARDSIAQAIVVKGRDIAYVGDDAQAAKYIGRSTKVFDLRGKTVIPGLIDTHIHAIRAGQTFNFENYWYETASLSEGLSQLAATARARGAGNWVVVMGSWHPQQFAEGRPPTQAELSQALPDNPAYVQYLYDYGLLNDRGIAALNLNDPSTSLDGVTVERDNQGAPTGKVFGNIAQFSALFNRISERDEPTRKESLRLFFNELNHHGVTSLIDPAGGGAGSHIYDPLFSLRQDQQLTVRVAYRVSAQAPGHESEWFRSTLAYQPPRFGDDMLKFLGLGEVLVYGMNDGVRMGPGFQATDAAREELLKVASYAAQRKYPLEIHAYTDGAGAAILDVFEEVAKRHRIDDLRWSITHLNTGSPATFERMRKLGLAYTVQMGPYFEAPAIAQAHSQVVAETSPPVRQALNAGLVVAGGTDSTRIGVFNIWRAIEYHVSGTAVGHTVQRWSDLNLSRLEVLRLFTVNGAYMTFEEGTKGSLEAGKVADFVVLDAPFLDVPVDRIHRIRALLTVVGGRIVFSKGGPDSAQERVTDTKRRMRVSGSH